MLNKKTQYAFKALMYLNEQADKGPVLIAEIARKKKIEERSSGGCRQEIQGRHDRSVTPLMMCQDHQHPMISRVNALTMISRPIVVPMSQVTGLLPSIEPIPRPTMGSRATTSAAALGSATATSTA